MRTWRGSTASARTRTTSGRIRTIRREDHEDERGRTHLAHKAEHAIDLETGAIVGITVQDADEGDTTTIQQTLPEVAEQLEEVGAVTDGVAVVIEEVVANKGYHSRATVHDLETLEIRTTSADRIAAPVVD